jgi:hypothetical protein
VHRFSLGSKSIEIPHWDGLFTQWALATIVTHWKEEIRQ